MSTDTQQQKQYKILLIGDSCIDEYHYGTCSRLNPEAPTPLLKIKKSETLPGMSANVRENLEGLGIEVTHITNNEIIKKIRFINTDYNVQLLRVDKEDKIKRINMESIKALDLNEYDGVVISDYDKGFLKVEDIAQINKIIESNSHLKVFVDTKKRDVSCFKKCFIKVNEHEYDLWYSRPQDLEIIVTCGVKGAIYKKDLFPACDININNVTRLGDRCGAGDTFLAGFVYKIVSGETIPKSIRFANYCAGLSVKKIGTYQLEKNDIKNFHI